MRLGRLALAGVVLLGWAGSSTASPLIPMKAGASLKPQNIVEAARWRHRHRGYVWTERGDDTDGPSRGLTGENRSTTLEVVTPDLGRRYHRGRFWGEGRATNRDETSDVAISLSGTNRFIPPYPARPSPSPRMGRPAPRSIG
jgi:hypothetical protein